MVCLHMLQLYFGYRTDADFPGSFSRTDRQFPGMYSLKWDLNSTFEALVHLCYDGLRQVVYNVPYVAD